MKWKFLKIGVVHFNHKFGCQKCFAVGEYDKDAHLMSFTNISAARKTNDTFRSRIQPEHHKETSPLEELEIDMINDFPSSDPLHLLELGIMKKCLLRWTGKLGTKSKNQSKTNIKRSQFRKWSTQTTEMVSDYLRQVNAHMPAEIHRAVRGLDVLSRWKGVEFRTLLLYVGMVALKPALPIDQYQHFLTLCYAVTICSCEVYKNFIPLASAMFNNYIEQYISIYGKNSISSNVHNLCHITEDMIYNNVGNLMQISTYKYENALRLLGMKLESCNKPLEQISRRLIEISNLNQEIGLNKSDNFMASVQYSQTFEGSSDSTMYSNVQISSDVVLSNRNIADKWFITRFGDIIKMSHAIHTHNEYKVKGYKLEDKRAFFENPLDSRKLNIFVSNGFIGNVEHSFDLKSIAAKMICIPFECQFVFIPLLHSLECLNDT